MPRGGLLAELKDTRYATFLLIMATSQIVDYVEYKPQEGRKSKVGYQPVVESAAMERNWLAE